MSNETESFDSEEINSWKMIKSYENKRAKDYRKARKMKKQGKPLTKELQSVYKEVTNLREDRKQDKLSAEIEHKKYQTWCGFESDN